MEPQNIVALGDFDSGGLTLPLGIHSPHRRSAPTESDKDAPPSVAPSPTPPGLLSLSLRPDTELEPGSITQHKLASYVHVKLLSFKLHKTKNLVPLS